MAVPGVAYPGMEGGDGLLARANPARQSKLSYGQVRVCGFVCAVLLRIMINYPAPYSIIVICTERGILWQYVRDQAGAPTAYQPDSVCVTCDS